MSSEEGTRLTLQSLFAAMVGAQLALAVFRDAGKHTLDLERVLLFFTMAIVIAAAWSIPRRLLRKVEVAMGPESGEIAFSDVYSLAFIANSGR